MEKTKDYGGISKKAYESYFYGKKKGVAIEIKDAIKYKYYQTWSETMQGRQVPQSFIYINKDLKRYK